MYGSHDMRHIVFSQVDGSQRDPWEMGLHIIAGSSSVGDWFGVSVACGARDSDGD